MAHSMSPIKNTQTAREYLKDFHSQPHESFRQQREEMLLKILDYPDTRFFGAMLEAKYKDADFMDVRLPMITALLAIVGYPVATRGALDAFEDCTWYIEARLLLGEQDEDENA